MESASPNPVTGRTTLFKSTIDTLTRVGKDFLLLLREMPHQPTLNDVLDLYETKKILNSTSQPETNEGQRLLLVDTDSTQLKTPPAT